MLISRRELENTVIVMSKASDETLEYASAVLMDWFRQILLGEPCHVKSDTITKNADRIILLSTRNDTLARTIITKTRQNLSNNHPEGYAIVSFRKGNQDIIALIGNTSVGVLWAVRDLIHFYADLKGGLKYDPKKGNCYARIAGARKIVIADVNITSEPAIRWRGLWAYDLDRNVLPPTGQKYFAENPYRWIEQMSRWKLNTMILYEGPHGQLIEVEPELFRYAKRRGIELIPSISFYSYATEAVAPSWCKRSPKRHKIPEGQLWATDRVMCPSDSATRRWMIDYVLGFIGRHRLKSLYFQIGDIDYSGCQCSECRKYSKADYFLFVTKPILREVYRVFPDIRIIAGVLNWPEYFQTINRLDERVEFLFEGGTFPSANTWGHDRQSNPSDLVPASKLREGKTGFIYRFYMGGMCPPWLDDRYWALGQLRDWLREQSVNNAAMAIGLMQRMTSETEPFLQAFFAQLCWDPEIVGKSFDKLISRVKEFSPLDPIYAELSSAPETSRLRGLGKFGANEQFHGIRGEYIGDVLQSEISGDIIHYETKNTRYHFALKKKLVRPDLILTGCVDENHRTERYPLMITVNNHKPLKINNITLPVGESCSAGGFINAGKFQVSLPYSLKCGVVEINIKLLTKYGWIWLKEIDLSGK